MCLHGIVLIKHKDNFTFHRVICLGGLGKVTKFSVSVVCVSVEIQNCPYELNEKLITFDA
jgi:hypothetical protein